MKKIFTLCFLLPVALTVLGQNNSSAKNKANNTTALLAINPAALKTVDGNNSSYRQNAVSSNNAAMAAAAYCVPTHTRNDKDNLINRVDFVGTLNDVTNSSNSNVGYEDFTGISNIARQEQGEAVNLNIYLYANGLFNAWVDWNKDGDFNDAGEQVYSTNGIFTNSTTFGFQVPAGQPVGNYRIRIRTANYYYYNGNRGPYYADSYTNANITPCGNLNDGQAEDYLFTVVSRCNARISAFENDTKCSKTGSIFDLSATGTTGTTAIKWYTAQTGGTLAATTPAKGTKPTAVYTTPVLKTTTTYWVTATDGTCESPARIPVVADMRPVPTITFTPASPTRICDGEGLNVSGTSSTETEYLINEGFEKGIAGSEFTVTTTNNTSADQPWQVRTSVFTPTSTAVWRPAISSGFGSNKFVTALGNALSSNTMVSTLTSAAHNTSTFTNLNLKFKLFYDHYLIDNNNTVKDNITIQAFDGANWNTLQQSGADIGLASNMLTLSYNLGAAYLNKTGVKIRFVYNAELDLSDGVAIDSIQLYGDRPSTNSYIWTQVGGLAGICLYKDSTETIPYVAGTTASRLYLKPTADQQEDGTPLAFKTELNASNGCTAVDTLVVNIDDKVWTGVNSTDWNIKANWCGNKVPVLSDRISIPQLPAKGNYPVIKLAVTGKSRFLTIDSGASLTIDSGAVLMIRRDLFTMSGAAFINNGTLIMQGIEAGEVQNFPGPGKIAPMNNLTINSVAVPPGDGNNVILNAPISVRGELSPAAGKLALGDNDITIKSSAAGTGFVSAVGLTAGFIYNGNGRFVVERYIPARRAWRFLSVPFDSARSTATINESWQEGKTNAGLDCAANQYTAPGYGTEITYNASNGYDANTTYNPSIKAWSNNAWVTPSGTNIPLNSYAAYCLFVRGDRTVCLSAGTSAIPTNTVLRARGVLNEPSSKTNIFSKTFYGNPGSFVMMGNPYASPVDLTNVLKTGRSVGIDNNKFWIWNPRANGAYGVGGYVAYSNGLQVPPMDGNSANATNAALLQSGQAFMVQLSSTSPVASINFQQGDKISSQINIFGRQADNKQAGSPYPVIYTNLMIPSNGSMSLTDGVGAAFGNKFSAAVDGDDAMKLWNFDENIALYRNSKFLSLEFRPVPALSDTLFYRLYLRQQPYTLQIFAQNFAGNNMPSKIWLVDNYLHTKTAINLNDTTLYNFTPNTDTLSYRNRFMMVFNRQLSTTPVPVTKVVNQADPNITGVAASSGITAEKVSITPNPAATAKNAMLKFSKMAKGDYDIAVYDMKGSELATQQIQHDGNSKAYHLSANANWLDGVYWVSVRNKTTAEIFTLKLAISN